MEEVDEVMSIAYRSQAKPAPSPRNDINTDPVEPVPHELSPSTVVFDEALSFVGLFRRSLGDSHLPEKEGFLDHYNSDTRQSSHSRTMVWEAK